MMVDRNETSEYALVDHMHNRQTASDMMLPVFQQHLDSLKLLGRNNRRMNTGVQILVSILPVFPVFMLIEICRKCLIDLPRCMSAALISFITLTCSINRPERAPAKPARAPATDSPGKDCLRK